jgi:hypothetical protein
MNILIRLSLLSLGAVLALSCGKSPPSSPTIDNNKGLQEIQHFEPFEVGPCIQVANSMLKRSMDLSIEGYLGRMSGAEPGVMSESKIDTGKHLFEELKKSSLQNAC